MQPTTLYTHPSPSEQKAYLALPLSPLYASALLSGLHPQLALLHSLLPPNLPRLARDLHHALRSVQNSQQPQPPAAGVEPPLIPLAVLAAHPAEAIKLNDETLDLSPLNVPGPRILVILLPVHGAGHGAQATAAAAELHVRKAVHVALTLQLMRGSRRRLGTTGIVRMFLGLVAELAPPAPRL